MKKRTVRMAVLTCTLAISLAPVSALAAPDGQPQVSGSSMDADGNVEAEDPLGLDEGGNAGDTPEGQEETGEIQETTEEPGGDESDKPDTEEEGKETENGGGSGTEDTQGTGQKEHVSAERLRAEKGGNIAPTASPEEDGDEEDIGGDIMNQEMEEEEKPSYTAPEDSRHANVSFAITEAVSSAFFTELTYPVSIGLKEVDTGDRVTLTVRSAGQILEVEKGDYAVVSIKDSGKVPLSVPGDTLHIYGNTEYTVRFAANNILKMCTDFLADNIFLACFFAFAALFYKKVFIPRFASDARRR